MLSSFVLIVIVVIDQFRTDELLRRHQLNPAGFGRLVKGGIFYDDAHHTQYFNMTCPGHTAISTGAQPGLHGIMLNEIWDRKTEKRLYCVADTNHQWIDAEADKKDSDYGTSPKFIKTSTVGDEVKALWPTDSKVISVAVKDRAAIALGGHHVDGAFWHAWASHKWTSSDYYFPNKKLPEWMIEFNKSHPAPEAKNETIYASSVDAVKDTTDLALAAVKNENLGGHKGPDILWVSYSTHDYVGHIKGDDSPELHVVLKAEDDNIGRLINDIKKKMGSKKFAVVLTADHGAGTDADSARSFGVPAGKMDEKETFKNVNACLKKDGVSSDKPIANLSEMNFFLSEDIKDKVDVRKKAKQCILAEEGIWYAFTRDEILTGQIPHSPWLKNLESSYDPSTGADVIGVMKPYWNSRNNRIVNHETAYDYDSWVPLAFWWPGIKPKMIHRRVSVVSLAPTLARILETRRPSGASDEYLGEVLSEALDKP